MIKINKNDLKNIVEQSFSKSEVLRRIGYDYYNSRLGREITNIINEYNIDISHFLPAGRCTIERIKYKFIEKECPVCGKVFKTQKGHTKEKTTCSHSCSNTYFRSGENHPNYMGGGYTKIYQKIAYENFEHKCKICGFDKKYALQVHHIDMNHLNNDINNLVILCSNCHIGVHRKEVKL